MRKRLDRLAPYLAYAGILGLFAGLTYWLINGKLGLIVEILLFVSVVLLGSFVLLRPAAVRTAIAGRQARYGGNAVLMSVAFLAILALLNLLSLRHFGRLDVTEGNAYSLSPQTIQILRGLQEPITITGFLETNDVRRSVIDDLLAEYRNYSNKITYALIDPTLKPAAAKQLGVTTFPTLILQRGEKKIDTLVVDEQGMTAAILRVSRDQQKTIYFVTGHKERDPDSSEQNGYSQIKKALEQDNYLVQTLNLSTLSDTELVPEDAAALIVASPQITFTESERNHFIDYLYDGGKVLMAFDPGYDSADPYILSDWGARVRNDLALDPSSSIPTDIATLMVTQYTDHQITKGLAGLTTLFPFARSLEATEPVKPSISVTPLVSTSKESWGETKLSQDRKVQYTENEDALGPLSLLIVCREEEQGGRLAVFGDSDFVSNEMLTTVGDSVGNADLFLNTVNWLTEDEDLIAISAKPTENRQLIMTSPQMRLVLYSSTILLPLAILAVGAWAWWSNR